MTGTDMVDAEHHSRTADTLIDMSATVAVTIQQDVQLRFLGPHDIPEVQQLCSDWFPIDYPNSWYEDITSSKRFYSLAATYNSHIMGIIVCEIKPLSRCNREDLDILSPRYSANTQVAYILSLGVVKQFRRYGIASLLLDSLLSYVASGERTDCKAVYLHVLTSNSAAIRFYENRNFHLHNYLPYYYSIAGMPRDGYSYVLYINGGQPPLTLFDYIKHVGCIVSKVVKLQPCALPQRILQSAQSLWRRLVNNSTTAPHQVHYS